MQDHYRRELIQAFGINLPYRRRRHDYLYIEVIRFIFHAENKVRVPQRNTGDAIKLGPGRESIVRPGVRNLSVSKTGSRRHKPVH